MKTYYLLANGQPDDRAVYYTGKRCSHGSQLWGNVTDAYKFERLDDVFEVIRKKGGLSTFIIVEVFESTLKIIERGFEDCINNVESIDRNVMNSYNTVSHITNSK